jgi:hypothetical protein
MKLSKIISVVLAVILVLNLVLIALKFIPPLVFWIVIIIGALTAFKVIPKIVAKGR